MRTIKAQDIPSPGRQFPGDLKEITREHAVRVLGLWGSSIFRPSFARFSADSAGNTMAGLQPGTLGKMETTFRSVWIRGVRSTSS